MQLSLLKESKLETIQTRKSQQTLLGFEISLFSWPTEENTLPRHCRGQQIDTK